MAITHAPEAPVTSVPIAEYPVEATTDTAVNGHDMAELRAHLDAEDAGLVPMYNPGEPATAAAKRSLYDKAIDPLRGAMGLRHSKHMLASQKRLQIQQEYRENKTFRNRAKLAGITLGLGGSAVVGYLLYRSLSGGNHIAHEALQADVAAPVHAPLETPVAMSHDDLTVNEAKYVDTIEHHSTQHDHDISNMHDIQLERSFDPTTHGHTIILPDYNRHTGEGSVWFSGTAIADYLGYDHLNDGQKHDLAQYILDYNHMSWDDAKSINSFEMPPQHDVDKALHDMGASFAVSDKAFSAPHADVYPTTGVDTHDDHRGTPVSVAPGADNHDTHTGAPAPDVEAAGTDTDNHDEADHNTVTVETNDSDTSSNNETVVAPPATDIAVDTGVKAESGEPDSHNVAIKELGVIAAGILTATILAARRAKAGQKASLKNAARKPDAEPAEPIITPLPHRNAPITAPNANETTIVTAPVRRRPRPQAPTKWTTTYVTTPTEAAAVAPVTAPPAPAAPAPVAPEASPLTPPSPDAPTSVGDEPGQELPADAESLLTEDPANADLLAYLDWENLSEEDKEGVVRAWSALDTDRKEQLRQRAKATTTKEEKVTPGQQA